MKTSNDMVRQIAAFEGCRLKAYRDIAGILTIGIGHTGSDVKEGMTITKERAMELLSADLSTAERAVERLRLTILRRRGEDMLQQQFDALVSLVYNCGVGSVREGTTMRKAIEMHGYYAHPYIGKAFMLWVKAYDPKQKIKVANKGLQKRRATEFAWYMYGSRYSEELKRQKVCDIITWATNE